MKEQAKGKRLLADIVLIAVLLALAAALYFLYGRGGAEAGTEDGPCAVVLIDGGEAARYPLSKDGVYVLNGGTNTLVIEGGYAWMTESQCPDKICEHMGKIHLNGQMVVCLPNKVIVVIEGGDDGGVDIFG